AEMRRRTPRYAALRYPEPISFEGARALLDRETAMVSYSVDPERVLVMVLTAGSLDVRKLDVRPDELGERVENYVGLLARDSENRWSALSSDLYAKLIAPWRDRLSSGVRRLIIVPDGVLHSLPFEALAGPGFRPRLLVEDFVVSYAPSATI